MSEAGLVGRLVEAVSPGALAALRGELDERLGKAVLDLNEYGFDRYGFSPAEARGSFLLPAIFYRHYFRVETHGIENVPAGPMLLIGNHSGQTGYDGTMLAMAMLLEAEPPRLARGMAEYFFWRVPWLGRMVARAGAVAGTPENCVAMLEEGQCVMVFPEGARGANKPYRKRYQLQRFGHGFMRLALETGAPIVPVGIVGAEEQQPGFANLESVGHKLGLPSLPLTISQPWFGPVGSAFALPVKYHIYIGEPLVFEGDAHEEDLVVQQKVDVVRAGIEALLERGLREREGIFR